MASLWNDACQYRPELDLSFVAHLGGRAMIDREIIHIDDVMSRR